MIRFPDIGREIVEHGVIRFPDIGKQILGSADECFRVLGNSGEWQRKSGIFCQLKFANPLPDHHSRITAKPVYSNKHFKIESNCPRLPCMSRLAAVVCMCQNCVCVCVCVCGREGSKLLWHYSLLALSILSLLLCVCVCVCAVSYTHLTLPTRRPV